VTTSLISLSSGAYRPYWTVYLKDVLLADTVAIGLLSAISSSERLLFQLPGGMLADRFGRRKIIVYGTALRMIPPIIYLMATHWTHTIPALLVSGAASIYMPAFNAIIADSLPSKQRGAGYGAYRMITSTPQFISPIAGGVVMDWLGYKQGVQIFMGLDFFVSAFVTYSRWKFLKETLDIEDKPSSGGRPRAGIWESLTSITRMDQSVKVMVLVTLFSSIGMRMVFDFLSLYALKELQFTNTQLGLVRTAGGLISLVLSMPAGMLSDRFGRKPMILISRTVSPICYLGVTQVTNYTEYFGVQFVNQIGNALGGGGMFAGGPAWNALLSELVPRDQLATVMGAIGTLSGIMAIPSPVIGGWLWEEFDPKMPFYVSVVFGLIGALIFAVGVKEPKRALPDDIIT
jgi:MFS family permease